MKFQKTIFIILIITSFYGCKEDEDYSALGKHLILYTNNKDSHDGKYVLLDLSDSKEYELDYEGQNTEYFFWGNKDNYLIMNQFGIFDVYNIKTKSKIPYYIHSKNQGYLYNYSVYKDSLIIFSDLNNIYSQCVKTGKVDTFYLNAGTIYEVLLNKNGIIAAFYSKPYTNPHYDDPKDLSFIDLFSKNKYDPVIKPIFMFGWKDNVNKIVYADSVIKTLSYPEGFVEYYHELDIDSLEINGQIKYINDSLLVFLAKSKVTPSPGNQLYIFNSNQKSVKQITYREGEKSISDTFWEQ